MKTDNRSRPASGSPTYKRRSQKPAWKRAARRSEAQPLEVCKKCNGSGYAPLSDAMRQTLSTLRALGATTAVEVLSKLPDHVTINAINNRLEHLRQSGLASRIRDGKYWVYQAAESATARMSDRL